MPLLLGELVRLQKSIRGEIDAADGRPRCPGDAPGQALHAFHGREVDDGVENLVELPRLDLLHHVRVVDDFPRVQVKQETDVSLGGLGHHRALVYQPQPLVFNGEPD